LKRLVCPVAKTVQQSFEGDFFGRDFLHNGWKKHPIINAIAFKPGSIRFCIRLNRGIHDPLQCERGMNPKTKEFGQTDDNFAFSRLPIPVWIQITVEFQNRFAILGGRLSWFCDNSLYRDHFSGCDIFAKTDRSFLNKRLIAQRTAIESSQKKRQKQDSSTELFLFVQAVKEKEQSNQNKPPRPLDCNGGCSSCDDPS
jgi:hypothetical protein